MAKSNRHSKKNSFQKWSSLISLSLIWVLVGCAKAQPNYDLGQTRVGYYDWTKEKWTASDTPYLKARTAIWAQYRARKINDAQLRAYKNASLRSPEDPLARFKWAYYGFCSALRQPDTGLGSSKLHDLRKEFRRRPSPGAYEYTRTRFLVEGYLTNYGIEMRDLSERLLRRRPDDYFVKYYAVNCNFTGKDEDLKRSLRYAQDLVKQNPNDAACHSLLGFVHQHFWWRTKSPDAARKAIASYRRYLAIAKPTGRARRQIENNIRSMQKT